MAEKKASAKKRYRRSPKTTAKRTVKRKKTVTSKSNIVGRTEFPSKEQAGRFKRKVSSTKKNKRTFNRYKALSIKDIPDEHAKRVKQLRTDDNNKKAKANFDSASKRQRKAAFLRMQTEGTLWKKAKKTGKRTVKNKTERPPRKIKQGGITW